MGKLDSKIAVVTGAAKGIGAAIASRLFEDGVEALAVLDLDLEQAEATAKALDPSGEKVIAMKCDVSNRDEVNSVFGKIIEKFGRVDILINNAGITKDAMFHKMNVEDWNKVINVNLNSMFYTCQAVAGSMRGRNYGKIVNISSNAAWGNAGQANYSASKGGVLSFTRTLAKEFGPKNITVNSIAPSLIDTDMIKTIPEELMSMALMLNPMRRVGQVSEVASVVSFLASDDSSYVTGECIQVNGGFLIV
ncbi:MAG: 3-oxoacyl-[acyl-carrier-protein] reductase [Firmicutes bacterium HGW-Firmicutes-16]|nr:MAG: 3-oxoacyl-[acyl-carrier-protein] reductase [Firmicutes bacterium HGW-Firmicutes-16]